MQTERRGFELGHKKSDNDAFQIELISEKEKQEILFSLSGIPILKRLVMVFRTGQMHLLNEQLVASVQKTLKQLILFVVHTESDDAFACEGQCFESRQRIYKQIYLLDILTDLLYQPFLNGIYRSLKEIPGDILQIFQLSYRLIKFSINEYRPNELYMSQWIELLMTQAMYDDKEQDIMVGET